MLHPAFSTQPTHPVASARHSARAARNPCKFLAALTGLLAALAVGPATAAAETPATAATAAPAKPWQINLSLAPSKGFLTLGRDLGLHYVGLGLGSLAYSSRDGLFLGPSLSYLRRWANPWMPYLGLTAMATARYHESNGGSWETAYLVPSVGEEIRFRHVYLHAEVYAASPMDDRFGRKWGPGVGAGIGVPF